MPFFHAGKRRWKSVSPATSMKPRKIILVLGAIYLLGLSFGGVCGMARNWMIAANYGSYRLETLVTIPGSGSSNPDSLFGTINGTMVHFYIAHEYAEQFRKNPHKEYAFWYDPGLPNMDFNGESLRGVLAVAWQPLRDFEIAAWLQAGMALFWATGFVWCVRAIKRLGPQNPEKTHADGVSTFAFRLTAVFVMVAVLGSVALGVARLWLQASA
jgi:hypothetical protein